MDLSIRTRTRHTEERCPACRANRRGGSLGPPRVHTCRTYESIGQAATRERQRQLAKLNRAR